MSRIRQLSICGIRNFDDQDQPRIRFSRPLTLILGPNGTGKTTIIEALRFATTGDFPPGSDRGKAFIHDCTTSAARVVRGVVKAEFVCANECSYTICRTIECLHTGTISKFKTLDSALSRKDKGAVKATSITNRCIDVNTEVISAMGVSKAILNYVIFCHQEEFSWPMDDGKKLKEKFDEIFDSVRINKALDNFLKCIKTLEQNAKVLKAHKNGLSTILAEVEDREKKRDDIKIRLELVTDEIRTIKQELEPIKEKISNIDAMSSKYETLAAEKTKKQLEYDVSKQQIRSLEENIREIFKGTMTELAVRLELYDENLSKKVSEISELEQKLEQRKSNEVDFTNKMTETKITVGTLKQQMQDQKKKIILRNKTLNEILSNWDIKNIVDKHTSDTDIAGLIQMLEYKLEILKHTADRKRQERNKEEQDLQKDIDILRSERSKIESEMNIKDNDATETRNEISRIEREIAQLGVAANKLYSVESKLEETNKKIVELSQSFNANTINEQINDESSNRDVLEIELSAVDEEIEILHKHSSLQAEMALHKSALRAKEEEVKSFKEKHEDNIKTLLGVNELSYIKLKDKLDAVHQKLVDDIKKITHEVQVEGQKLATTETTLKYNERELRKKLSELESNKQKISSVCDYKEFDEVLLLQSKQVKDLQDKRGMYAYQGVAYKNYMKQLQKDNPCCPLCHRNFDKSYEIGSLITEMEEKIKSQPDTFEHCEADLKAEQKKYDTMLQLKPIVEKINKLESAEIPILEESLKDIKEELARQKVIIQEKERLKAIPEEKLNKSKSLFEDVMLWDRLIDEINNLQQKLWNIESVMAKTGTIRNRTMSEAQAHRDELKSNLKKSGEQIQNLQTKLNTFNEKLQRTREERNALFEEQLKIQSEMQKLKQLRENHTELTARRVTLVQSVQKLQDKLLSSDNKLETAISQLDILKKENWKKEEADRTVITERGGKLFELNKIQNEVSSFNRSDVSTTLSQLELRINNYEAKISANIVEKNKLEATLRELTEEINQQETRKRDLSDNLTLRKLQISAQDLQQQCENLSEKLDNMNYTELMEKLQKFKSHEESLLQKINIAKGKREELERVMIQNATELTKEKYRNARKNYMDNAIELEGLKEAIKDLQKYCKVLDIAMIKYHQERMATVNKIMKKLWNAIYVGNDTTSIEIRTDNTGGIGCAQRRSYNYKLVQIKNGKEMDMRGRCSAGQKVLASIIIRLALAETFCKDCGILALDEPTTNLDEENTNSLADALNVIVKMRSRYQKNFQLIVISHDEKFLTKLAHLNDNSGYYELYRKENGLSSVRFRQMGSIGFVECPKLEARLSDEEDEDDSNSQQTVSRKRAIDSRGKDSNNDNDKRPTKKRFVYHLS